MSPRHSLTRDRLQKFLGISVLLAFLPAFSLAVAKWLLFAGYLDLGMYQTAFYYFRAAVNKALAFPIILLPVVLTHLLLSAVLKDYARADRFMSYAAGVALLGLLLATGYTLNKSAWYPPFLSTQGLAFNAVVVLLFAVAGFFIVGKRPWSYLPSTAAIALVIVLTNAYFYYSRATTPVLFTDVAEDVGLRQLNNSLGVAWGDYNDDGWMDVYVSNHLPASTNSLLYENRQGVFSSPRPIATGDLHGAAWADFDNDGALDLFVAGGNNTPIGPAFANLLFRSAGGALEDVASRAGVEDTPGRAWGGTWADFNNDGFLDLFVANYFTSNALFLNTGNGTFRNVARAGGLTRTAPGEANEVGTLCASWADYDADDDMDILIAAIGTGLALYQNDGDGVFSDVASSAGLVTAHYLGTEKNPRGLTGCTWGDYDNDGDLDVFVAAFSDTAGQNLLFRNQGDGTFVEVGAAAGVNTAANSRAAMWADFDNDGDLDLYVVNEASDAGQTGCQGDTCGWNTMYLNKADGTFIEVSADLAGTAGFPYVHEGTGAVADYDNNGFVDIFITNQRGPEGHSRYLTRNILLCNSGNGNNWLKLRLRGTASNRDGVGAKVFLSAGGHHQFRETGGESHTFAQNSTVVHFGLGKTSMADMLTIKWPSGITQTLSQVPASRTLTIVEPSAANSSSSLRRGEASPRFVESD